jgi:hypothetical protein
MSRKYKHYLFERLENGDSREESNIYRKLETGDYSIEHIMPQSLTPAWRASLGLDAEEIHAKWLHRLGNLTITAYNSEYSNRTFEEKKTCKNGLASSGIRLNLDIAKSEKWGEDEIRKRANELADRAVELWAYPVTTYAPNKQTAGEYTLDDETSMTGMILTDYSFRGETRTAKSWTEMYMSVLKELHSENKTVFNRLADEEKTYIVKRRAQASVASYAQLDNDIYIRTGLNTNGKIVELQRFFKLFDENPENLIFYVQATENSNGDS